MLARCPPFSFQALPGGDSAGGAPVDPALFSQDLAQWVQAVLLASGPVLVSRVGNLLLADDPEKYKAVKGV